MAHLSFPRKVLSLLFTLLALVTLNLVLLDQEIICVADQKSCDDFCTSHRPKGIKQRFEIDCMSFPEKCKTACEGELLEVFNPSLNKIVCRAAPALNAECKDHCEDNRPKGHPFNYTLNCIDLYKTDSAKNESCIETNKKCADYIRDDKQEHLIYCPYESIAENRKSCRNRCDGERWKNMSDIKLDKFDFTCKDAICQTDCDDVGGSACHLPWACNKSATEVDFHCPPYEPEGICKQTCDKYRVPMKADGKFRPARFYTFNCDDTERVPASEKGDCENACKSCSKLCANNVFKCPPPTFEDPFPAAKTVYEGACMMRCNLSRPVRDIEYLLHCEDMFETADERKLCRDACKECPPSVCDYRENQNEFRCPGKPQNESAAKREEECRMKRVEGGGAIGVCMIACAVGYSLTCVLATVGFYFFFRKFPGFIGTTSVNRRMTIYQALNITRKSMSAARQSVSQPEASEKDEKDE